MQLFDQDLPASLVTKNVKAFSFIVVPLRYRESILAFEENRLGSWVFAEGQLFLGGKDENEKNNRKLGAGVFGIRRASFA
jgi:hypothetical protein